MQKRGLSSIVTTLIIIVLVIVSIGIVWVGVKAVMKSGTEEIGLGQFTIEAEIQNVKINNVSNSVSLVVKRSRGEGEISKIKFFFSDGTNSEIITQDAPIDVLEQKSFDFSLTQVDVDNLVTISIVPLREENGEEVVGNVADEYKLKETSKPKKKDNQTCTPITCVSQGHECGFVSDGCSGTLNCGTCSSGDCVNGQCVLGNQTTCTPITCASKKYNCGTWANGTCTGVMNCGTCPIGSCNSTGGCISSCTPTTCANLGYQCGNWSNGTCSGTLNCGKCSSGDCVDGQCALGTPTSCTPWTCASKGYTCGTFANGTCLGVIGCGNCATGYSCVSGHCVSGNQTCTPKTCASLGYKCGTWANGTCSGTLNCGICGTGYNCVSGTCVSTSKTCTPKTCSSLKATCGKWANGTCAGTFVNCGTCPSGYNCNATGGCSCTPTTCHAFAYDCGSHPNGCGGTMNCGSCWSGYYCDNGHCKTDKTCIDMNSHTPDVCDSLRYQCGQFTNGPCAGYLNCGNCSFYSGYECVVGNDMVYECHEKCTPQTCSSLGRECGEWPNGNCAGTLNCGTCPSGYICNGVGKCVLNNQACIPVCSGKDCGDDGCGGTCGTCPDQYTCSLTQRCVNTYGTTCTPTTCAFMGYDCGYWKNGNCSTKDTLNCGTCPSGQVCNYLGKCVPKTCIPTNCYVLEHDCGTWSDGCGGTLNCGTCPSGQVCNPLGKCSFSYCTSRGYECGYWNTSNGTLNCGTCPTGKNCDVNTGKCVCANSECTSGAPSSLCEDPGIRISGLQKYHKCGYWWNYTNYASCPGILYCGTCPAGYYCFWNYVGAGLGNMAVEFSECIKGDCTSLTCEGLGYECGGKIKVASLFSEGWHDCTGILDCGECPAGYKCDLSKKCIPL